MDQIELSQGTGGRWTATLPGFVVISLPHKTAKAFVAAWHRLKNIETP